MNNLTHLFEKNRLWTEGITASDPHFFEKLCAQQAPEYLWIGCADSRVPANEIVGLLPGELFVHRNVANLVIHSDMNCLSVIQYAVEVLKVKHIIVCGHYGCGGVKAAMDNAELGLIDNWLRHIRDVYYHYEDHFKNVKARRDPVDLLCELNVLQQVLNVCQTTFVEKAWNAGQEVSVHGWVYRLSTGLLQDLGLCVSNTDEWYTLKNKAVPLIGYLH